MCMSELICAMVYARTRATKVRMMGDMCEWFVFCVHANMYVYDAQYALSNKCSRTCVSCYISVLCRVDVLKRDLLS